MMSLWLAMHKARWCVHSRGHIFHMLTINKAGLVSETVLFMERDQVFEVSGGILNSSVA